MPELITYIAIFEPSDIIFEGISNILTKAQLNLKIYRIFDICELNKHIDRNHLDIFIFNPAYFLFNKHCIQTLVKKKHFKQIGILTSIIDSSAITYLDATISLSDSIESITKNITRFLVNNSDSENNQASDNLSEREKDVLIQLVNGLSNKEIADKLNISVHTVVSHRKNITHKTGIKSQSGLTIYAISNKFISLEDFPK